MADEKKKPVRIIVPKFVAMYAWLSTPNTKHDKNGKYTVSGLFDPKIPEHRAFLGQLKKLHTAAVADARTKFKPSKKQKELEVTPCMYEEEDRPLFRVNFGEKAFIVVKDKNTQEDKKINLKPPVVDARGVETDVEVWSGSEIKAAIDVVPFFSGNKSAGLSLRLKGVQVITLRTRGSRDGASLGFGVEEGFGNGSGFGDETAATDEGAGEFDAGDDFAGSDDEQEFTDETPAAPAGELAPSGDDDDFDF